LFPNHWFNTKRESDASDLHAGNLFARSRLLERLRMNFRRAAASSDGQQRAASTRTWITEPMMAEAIYS
jgi:hypothetical protein